MRLVVQVVIVSAVVTGAVVFAGVLSGRSGNLLASFSDLSALQGLLTVVLFFSLSYGLIGGTAGGLLLLRAKSRLESSSLSIRALWGLKWGAFLGFLIPATIAGLASVISADAGFEWSAEHLILPLLGAFTGSVSGVIVSTCCLFPRHFSAVSTLKKVSPG